MLGDLAGKVKIHTKYGVNCVELLSEAWVLVLCEYDPIYYDTNKDTNRIKYDNPITMVKRLKYIQNME